MRLTERELFVLAVVASYAQENTEGINEAFEAADQGHAEHDLEVWCPNARTWVRGVPIEPSEIRALRDALIAAHRAGDLDGLTQEWRGRI